MTARSVKTRRLGKDDAGHYRDLMLRAYRAHPDAFTTSVREAKFRSSSWWAARAGDGSPGSSLVIGAFSASRLVGVVGLSFEAREKVRHKVRLFGMYVLPSFRGRGIGKRLVQRGLAEARRHKDARLVQLTVTEGNSDALKLYEKCGFVRFGVEPLAVAVGDKHVSKVHMWRPL